MRNILQLLYRYESKLKYILVLFSFYCAIIVGQSWDEGYYKIIGKINLDYLLSFGFINEEFYGKYRYSTIYWTFSSLLSQFFPREYNVEAHHIINTVFGLFSILGLYKIVKKLFNKNIGKISCVFLFLTPTFFGHLAINSKDTIMASAHLWISYYLIKYIFKNLNFKKRLSLILKVSLLSAIGTGIQLVFLGSMLPFFLFFLIACLYLGKFKKDLYIDIILYLIVFYLILILFWVDVHSNIFVLPYKFFLNAISLETGWPFNLYNGKYFFSNTAPINYILLNLYYKLPEFTLYLYLIAIPIMIIKRNELESYFSFFKFKIFLVISILIYPNMIMLFIPYAIYDGLRLFLWFIPYLTIIPAICLYFIYQNRKKIIFNIHIYLILILFLYHLAIFFSITPYQYTYLNILSGKKNEQYKKFENDYWSTSLKELILNSDLDQKKTIKFSSCGINHRIAIKYMSKKYPKALYTELNKADYLILTNRTLYSDKKKEVTNCFDEFTFKNISAVSRNGNILSAIKKIE